jgi:hypothetical protein
MTKIVINSCYGGFSLSEKGIKRYAELKGINLYIEPADFGYVTYWTIPKEELAGIIKYDDWHEATPEAKRISNELYDKYTLSTRNFDRTDPILVQVVEELGEKASGNGAKLIVVQLEKGTKYRIEEFMLYPLEKALLISPSFTTPTNFLFLFTTKTILSPEVFKLLIASKILES